MLLVVILMTFLMMRQIGGNPFRQSERNVPESIQANLERKFHLDDPRYRPATRSTRSGSTRT